MAPPPGNGDGGVSRPIDAALVDASEVDASDASSNDNQMSVIDLIKPGLLVAGTIDVDLHITDAEGVGTVTATIAGDLHPIALRRGEADHWVGQFDTVVLAGVVSPNITVTVVDQAGVTATRGFPITLDNSSPIASMDPPRVRMFNAMQSFCSAAFDPLGDAPDDRETVAQLSEFRARVQDRPNTGTLNANTTVFIPMAGVDTVKLHVLHSTGAPLAVDSNGDGKCDRINPNTSPVILSLTAAPPKGAGVFGVDDFTGDNAHACLPGSGGPVNPVCEGEQSTTIVISTPFDHQPAIFGIPAVDNNNCLGYVFDAKADQVADGWACVAVETTDHVGNRNVSAPIRVCINSNDSASSSCGRVGTFTPENDPAIPNCTGTLLPSGVVDSTKHCEPEKFFDSGVVGDYELIRQ